MFVKVTFVLERSEPEERSMVREECGKAAGIQITGALSTMTGDCGSLDKSKRGGGSS